MIFRLFLTLHLDICRMIVWDWISPKSLCDLDTAICCHEVRPLYLSWVKDMPMELRIPLPRGDTLGFLRWCGLRQVRLQDLLFSLFVTHEFDEIFEQLSTIIAEQYPHLFAHARCLTCLGGSSDLYIAAALWSYLSTLVELELSSLSMHEAHKALNHLPIPSLLKKLRVYFVEELNVVTLPSESMFWEVVPQLHSLELDFISTEMSLEAWLSMYTSWSTMPCLRELILHCDMFHHIGPWTQPLPARPVLRLVERLELDEVRDDPAGSVLSTFLPHHCPALKHLKLRYIAVLPLHVIQGLVEHTFPHLQRLEWSSKDSQCAISVPDGYTLAPLMTPQRTAHISNLDSDSINMQEWSLLPFFRPMHQQTTACPYKAVVTMATVRSTALTVPLWLHFLTRLTFVTDMILSHVRLSASDDEWAEVLTFGCLRTLQILRCVDVDGSFADGVKLCFALGWTSPITKLWILEEEEPLYLFSSLLPSVFPSLTQVSYQVPLCMASDLLCILRCPQLHTLALGSSVIGNGGSLLLDTITSTMWERVSLVSVCITITFAPLEPPTGLALQRLLESPLGQRLRRLIICTEEENEWRDLLASSEDWLHNHRHCHIQVRKHYRVLLLADCMISTPL